MQHSSTFQLTCCRCQAELILPKLFTGQMIQTRARFTRGGYFTSFPASRGYFTSFPASRSLAKKSCLKRSLLFLCLACGRLFNPYHQQSCVWARNMPLEPYRLRRGVLEPVLHPGHIWANTRHKVCGQRKWRFGSWLSGLGYTHCTPRRTSPWKMYSVARFEL